MTAGEPIGKQDTAIRIVAASGVDLPDAITGAFDVVTVPPFGPDQVLPAELLDGTAVLLSDVAPANSTELTDLRWLQLGSAGYAQLAGHRLASRGVTVTNASGVNDIPIAEWCVLMMLSLERDFVDILRGQQERDYQRPALYQRELRGRTVGIVGYGGIGREVARLSKALGLSVWAMNRSPIGPALDRFTPADTGDPLGALPDRSFANGDWDAFLPNLDYLVLTVALNDATRGMIGADQLDLLPAHAFLLNPARAQLIEEAALQSALHTGSIAGAALDSHYSEPLQPDDATWELPNTIVTPHISGSTSSPQYLPRLWELFGENLRRFSAGVPLLNVVPAGDLPV